MVVLPSGIGTLYTVRIFGGLQAAGMSRIISCFFEIISAKYRLKESLPLHVTQGNLGKAIRLATSDEYKEIIKDVTGVLRKIPDMTVDDIMFAIKNMNHHKLKIGDYIDLMMMWYRDILMLKITGNAGRLMFKEYYTDIRKQSSHISYEGIEDVLKAMDKAKIRLEANVNFDVAMELMLLTIKENK